MTVSKAGASSSTNLAKWSGTPGCVMFGSAKILVRGTTNTYNYIPPTFCSQCAVQVRKVDLQGNVLKGFAFQFYH